MSTETIAVSSCPGAEVHQKSHRIDLRRLLNWVGPLLILVILCVVMSIMAPRFATTANAAVILNQLAVPMVVAVGITFVVLMGSIDLSAQGTMALTSIVVSLLLANSSTPIDLGVGAVAIALAVGLVIGLLNGFLHTRFRLPSLMVTFGTWFIGLGLASYLFPGSQPRIIDQGFRQLALGKLLDLSWNFYLAAAVVLLAVAFMRWTRPGRMIYGIGSAEAQLTESGVPVRRYRVIAFALSGFCAGLAGVMITAQIGSGTVSAGYDQLFPAISAIVLGGTLLSGGRGGIAHTVVGVLILTVLNNSLLLLGVSPYIQQAIVGVALVAIVAFAGWGMRGKLRIIK